MVIVSVLRVLWDKKAECIWKGAKKFSSLQSQTGEAGAILAVQEADKEGESSRNYLKIRFAKFGKDVEICRPKRGAAGARPEANKKGEREQREIKSRLNFFKIKFAKTKKASHLCRPERETSLSD